MNKPPSLGRRGGLFAKYFVSLVGIVTLVLLINGAFDMWFAYGSARDALGRLQQEKAHAAAERVGQFVTGIERQISWTTHAQWAALPVEQRRIDFFRLQNQEPAIAELTQIDGQGREQLKVSRLDMDAVGSNVDLSKDPRFIEVQNKRVWYSPIYLRKGSEPFMSMSLARAGRRAGATVAEVNLKLIRDVVDAIRVGEKGYAYVVDRDGALIAHPDLSLVLRNTSMSGLTQVRAALGSAQASKPGTGPGAAFGQSLDGTPVLTSFAAIPALGWLVFVEQPTTEALRPLYTSMWQTLILLGLGLAIAAIGAWFLSRRMTAPIQAMQLGAQRIGGGELGHRLSIKTGDELESLADEFNRSAEALQESYATLEHRVEDRTRELSESLEQQTVTADILRVISQSPTDVQPVLRAIAKAAVRFCGAEDTLIVLSEGSEIQISAHEGPIPADESRWPLDRGTAMGRAMLERQTVHLADIEMLDPAEFPGARELSRREGFKASVAAPMMREDQPMGAVLLRRREVGAFTPRQIELLETFASQAVIAIENVRLFKELRARTTALTESLEHQTAMGEVLRVISQSPIDVQPVLDAVVAAACRFCGAGDALIVLRDGDESLISAHEGPLMTFLNRRRLINRDNLTGRALLDGIAVHVPDITASDSADYPDSLAAAREHRWRAALTVPMMREGVAVGAIMLRKTDPGAFTGGQIELLETFAAQAVIAIENVRLFKELRSRTDELVQSLENQTATADILRVISQSPTDIQPVLAAVVAAACRFCGAVDAAVILREDDHVVQAAHQGPLSSGIGRRHPLDRSSIMGRAIVDGRLVHAPDVHALDPAEFGRAQALAHEYGFAAAVAAPMLREDSVIGSVLLRRQERGAFTPRQMELLETFAAQAVIAIENVRLFTEIQEKSRQLELASQHKSQFLANMSHELRTPLNAIIGYTEMMADGLYGEVGDKGKGVLERVQANGRHLLGLINDVLDLSKIEAGQLTLAYDSYSVADMVTTVVSATESLAHTKGLAFTSEVASGLPTGRGDARRLSQVLLNLVGNAIKFTDRGSVEIRASQSAGNFEISVIDTGPGILPEDQARIFDEFQQVDSTSTRRKGGSGLGLSISRRIVGLHGGTLSVESEVGKGSIFKVSIPFDAAKIKDAA